MAEQKPTEPKTKLQKARDFKSKYEAMLQEGKEEALSVINEQLAELKELGFEYQLVEAGQTPKPVKAGTPGKAKDPDKPCSYCGEKGHDARKHRAEILAKKAAEKAQA